MSNLEYSVGEGENSGYKILLRHRNTYNVTDNANIFCEAKIMHVDLTSQDLRVKEVIINALTLHRDYRTRKWICV